MYLICCCDDTEETVDIAYQYQVNKIKPRPRIYISTIDINEVKASRNWNGLIGGILMPNSFFYF